MKRKKVEAWAVTFVSGGSPVLLDEKPRLRPGDELDDNNVEAVVHLVERDPAAEALARIALRCEKRMTTGFELDPADGIALMRAVECYEKSRAKR